MIDSKSEVMEFFFFEDQNIKGTYSSVFTNKNLGTFRTEDLEKAIFVVEKKHLDEAIEKLEILEVKNRKCSELLDAANERISELAQGCANGTETILNLENEIQRFKGLIEKKDEALKELVHVEVGIAEDLYIEGVKCSTLKTDRNGKFIVRRPAKEAWELE